MGGRCWRFTYEWLMLRRAAKGRMRRTSQRHALAGLAGGHGRHLLVVCRLSECYPITPVNMLSKALRGAHLLALLTGPGATSGSSVGLTVGYMGLDEGDVLRGDGAVSRWPCARQTRSFESASRAPHRIRFRTLLHAVLLHKQAALGVTAQHTKVDVVPSDTLLAACFCSVPRVRFWQHHTKAGHGTARRGRCGGGQASTW